MLTPREAGKMSQEWKIEKHSDLQDCIDNLERTIEFLSGRGKSGDTVSCLRSECSQLQRYLDAREETTNVR